MHSLGAGALTVGGLTQVSVDVSPTDVIPENRVKVAVSCDPTSEVIHHLCIIFWVSEIVLFAGKGQKGCETLCHLVTRSQG